MNPKDLTNKTYLREQFFTFKMDASKNLLENLDEFKKISLESKRFCVKIGDESETFYTPKFTS